MRLDGVAFHIDWDCPSRVKTTVWDDGLENPEYKQSWWFTMRAGVRRARRTQDQKNRGYKADHFNPFVHVRLLGLFIATAFSISWGVDSPQEVVVGKETEHGKV